MLTKEERQARYSRIQARLERGASLKKAHKERKWAAHAKDSNPTGEPC